MSLISELRRRNVFRVAAAYLVVGWLLTEVLTTILPTLGAPDWMARAVILIFAFGFIPVVVLSWFYEITPDGIQLDRDVDHDLPERRRAARRVDQVTIAAAIALILVVGLFSARYSDHETDAVAPGAASIAVLPFVNMSNDADNEYFSDGLTETLLHMLATIPELQVAARTSSFAFKGQNISIQEIARALDVAHVLEGSVQRAGDRVRITAQLIRASDGFHMWSEVYDRELDDIFGIQDEIASRVGTALSASLLGEEIVATGSSLALTADADAYDLFLQARKEQSTISYGGLQAAEDLLKGALLVDPDFSEARIELATNYLRQMETGLIDQDDALAQVVAMTDQVLAVQPEDTIAKANSLYAHGLQQLARGNAAAIPELAEELGKLCAAAPAELDAHILLVRVNTLLQRNEDSLPLLEAALRGDPYNALLHYELGAAYIRLQRPEEARTALKRALAIEPAQPNAYVYLGTLALRENDGAGFVRQYLQAIAVDPRDHELPGMLALILYQLGLVEEGDEFRAHVMSLAPLSEIAYQIALLRAVSIGDEEASADAARRVIEDDIPERRGSYSGAVQHLLRTAVRDDRVAEEFAWLEAQAPGMFDVEASQLPAKYRGAQGAAFDAWTATLPRQEVVQKLDALLNFAAAGGTSPLKDPGTRMTVHLLRGESEEAIRVALEEYFTRPVAENLNWEETLAQAQFAPLVADPRVQAAMQRWREDQAALRDSVRAYFADLNASS